MPRLHPDQLQQTFWVGPSVSWFLKLTRWFQCVAKAALNYLHRWILLRGALRVKYQTGLNGIFNSNPPRIKGQGSVHWFLPWR